ncbi:peptidoglycan-binding protein [Neobacillus vireti]|uniref:peptidoglycan-binding protein n=1 Tax=Neobacillus vireti TaxID=220686 RepID=UPI002FFEE2D9
MTITLDWLLEKANKKLNVAGMNLEVANKTREVIKEMFDQNIYICVAQGFRSFAEQNALYAIGRTASGKKVTNAKGGQSNHNFGVAVDLCLFNFEGSDVIWEVNPTFKKVVAAMKAKGFKWGGDWKSFKDYPHFELYDVVGGEKPKSYSPTTATTPTSPSSTLLKIGANGTAVKELQTLLNKKGYQLKVDGDFGNATDTAVRDYQSKNGLDVDGIAGQLTLNKLKYVAPVVQTPPVVKPKLNGWKKNEKSEWNYYVDDVIQKDRWIQDAGKWFYLKGTVMVTNDWVTYKNNKYYLAKDGSMVTGFYNIDGKFYFFNLTGTMAHDVKLAAESVQVNPDGSISEIK